MKPERRQEIERLGRQADPVSGPRPGQTLSHYRILEKLGEGGMSVVYKAQDTKLDRPVALKFLAGAPWHSGSHEALERFKREARAASALNHPNICTIYEIAEHQGQPFIAMELLKGETLRERIDARGSRSGPVSQPEVSALLGVAAQVADALDAAHAEAIIHRDIKPANIFINERGQAKLLDFGVAKMAPRRGHAEQETATLTNQTAAGMIPGTLAYMSPEQIRGEELDCRTDLFSFGAVLYEMATGRMPFSRPTAATVYDAILNRAPTSPVELNSGVPAELARIILRALEKDRGMRYQHASDMRADLACLKRDSESGSGAAVRTTGPARRRPWQRWTLAIAMGATELLLAAVGSNVGGLRDRLRTSPGAPRSDSLAVLPMENLSGDPAQEYLADSLTDELIGDMARIGSLRVISRTSAMRYKGAGKAVPEIARELHVDGVVESSVKRSGDRIRINVKLIHAPTDRQLWANSYERDAGEAVRLQQQITLAVAHEISARLTAEGEAHLAGNSASNARAYDAYLRGRYLWNQRGTEAITEAVSYFEQALRADPDFALAWSGLSDCYTIGWGAKSDFGKAEEYARKAISLDPNLPEAHASMSLAQQCQFQYAQAEKELKRPIELNPNYVSAYQFYTIYLLTFGRAQEALAQNDRALQLDPFSLPVNCMRGIVLLGLHEYDRAVEQLQTAAAIDPQSANPHSLLARTYWFQRRVSDAVAKQRRSAVLGHRPAPLSSLEEVEAAYARSGFRAACLKAIQVKETAGRGLGTPADDTAATNALNIALHYACLQDAPKVLEFLDRSLSKKGYGVAVVLKTAPELDFMRSDPGVQALLRRIGLPP